MGSSRSRRRGAASQFGNRLRLCALTLPALLLACGCDRLVESDLADLADLGVEDAPRPMEAAEPDVAIVAEETATVPNVPLGQPKAEPGRLDEPPKKLGIGDANPGLQIAKWMKGSPVDEPLTDKVHVVEFWATWCGPCRVGMPHISKLQTEYGEEVAFIGVTREDEGKVARFLESESPDGRIWDEVIQYRLAIDDRAWSNSAYMRAAGQNGIPCAFVVGRDGVVEWIGHPARIDEPLKQIVEGSWDREAAIVQFQQQERLREISAQIARLTRSKDWDGALELLDQLEVETGKSTGLLQHRLRILESAGRSSEASAVRTQLVEEAWNDASMLNEIAWTTATSRGSPDLELALKAAERASELRENKDPAVLDTVARCFYELGQLEKAITWQRLAVEHNNGHREIDAALERYLTEKSQAEQTGSSEELAPDETQLDKESAG
jgi:thiol-disulfide isomerase/thioredoxin